MLGPSAGLGHTDARGVSGDGAYVVGRSRPLGSFTSNVGATACRWDASGAVELLWPQASGSSGVALDANEDGSVAVGWESGPGGVVPVRWEEGVGVQVIPPIPGFPVMCADVVSLDGQVVAGFAWDQANERVGWRYVVGEGVTVLPPPPGSPFIFQAVGVSQDGSRIAFRASDDTAVWTEWGGMHTLEAYSAARGLAYPNLNKIDYGLAMSDDGTTFFFADAFTSEVPSGPKFRLRDGSLSRVVDQRQPDDAHGFGRDPVLERLDRSLPWGRRVRPRKRRRSARPAAGPRGHAAAHGPGVDRRRRDLVFPGVVPRRAGRRAHVQPDERDRAQLPMIGPGRPSSRATGRSGPLALPRWVGDNRALDSRMAPSGQVVPEALQASAENLGGPASCVAAPYLGSCPKSSFAA